MHIAIINICEQINPKINGDVRYINKDISLLLSADAQDTSDPQAADGGVLHLRSRVREQVDQHPRASVHHQVARRERQAAAQPAQARAAETAGPSKVSHPPTFFQHLRANKL